ncbi:MAG: pyruvate kinase [Nitrospirae bacterium]|nr:pyruvate kinase [Nitrospirota bacterium]
MQLPNHKTKIVCTIGPASRSKTILKRLIKGGMNVARLNFSHGSLEDQRENIHRIKSVANQLNQTVAILIDLPGPKIRIGNLQCEPLTLKKGHNVSLTTENIPGTESLISVNYEKLPVSVAKGSKILLNDGFIQLKVLEISGQEVKCKVMIGGQLLSHKGLNLPKAKMFLNVITDRDLEFVDFGLSEGVNTFSVSFVEKAADILKVKQFARERGKSIYTVAKIERAEAVKNIDELLEVTDAVMVARGDLGDQIPIEEVPIIQKKIIHKANLLGRPAVTATQMLGSMVENIRPTRAEATDVANAILDGTDAVMLSEETAIGKYPVEALEMMTKIAVSVERQQKTVGFASGPGAYFKIAAGRKKTSVEDVISMNVLEATHQLDIRFILAPTNTGNTPRRISRVRPDSWILSFCRDKSKHDFLSFTYGVHPVLIENKVDNWPEFLLKFIKDSGLTRKGQKVILTLGAGQSGGTDSLRVMVLP